MIDFDALLSTIRSYPVVSDDTRDMIPGGIFVHGGGRARQDEFLDIALDCGAALVVSETEPASVPASMLVRVDDRRIASARLARSYYGSPDLELTMIGVTGTCGKTTTTYLLERLLTAAGHEVGLIGTEAIRYKGISLPSPNTTPSAFVLHKTLRTMRDAGCSAAAMEVSSHALAQERTQGLAFDAAIFTNLSVEHLDVHGSMEAYFQTKARLFLEYAEQSRATGKILRAVIGHDDAYGRRLFAQLCESNKSGAAPVPFGLSRLSSGYDGSALTLTSDGIGGAVTETINNSTTAIGVDCQLVGAFNAQNVLGAVAVARQLGAGVPEIEDGLKRMIAAPGRMTRIGHPGKATIVVDYAHKPGALEVVLKTLRPLTAGRLVCVFGCGGQRDRAKRPEMGRIAAALADQVIITADNARGEPFNRISAEILAGVPADQIPVVSVVPDRQLAISSAIRAAEPGDLVLIAGRGAEAQLSVMGLDGSEQMIDLDDRLVAEKALAA